jgi:hypothetical protein
MTVSVLQLLYKNHVTDLQDCDATIAFTQKMNDICDLMNSRRPVEGVRMHGKHDKVKVITDECVRVKFCFVCNYP